VHVVTGQRTILSNNFRFDDQLILPRHTRIAFPALQIHTDADNYPDPLRFNPYRFMGGKANEGNSHSSQGESVAAFRIDDKYLS
jgi:cytochrome P450